MHIWLIWIFGISVDLSTSLLFAFFRLDCLSLSLCLPYRIFVWMVFFRGAWHLCVSAIPHFSHFDFFQSNAIRLIPSSASDTHTNRFSEWWKFRSLSIFTYVYVYIWHSHWCMCTLSTSAVQQSKHGKIFIIRSDLFASVTQQWAKKRNTNKCRSVFLCSNFLVCMLISLPIFIIHMCAVLRTYQMNSSLQLAIYLNRNIFENTNDALTLVMCVLV